MKRVLLLPIGSSGDVNPFVWLGRQLRDSGHEVAVVANPFFARTVEAAGLRHLPIGSEADYQTLTGNPALWHPTKGTPLVMRYAGEAAERYYEIIRREAEREANPPLVLAPVTAFGAMLAREKLGITLISVNLQPSIYRSVHETPYFGRDFEFIGRLPRWAKRAFFSLVDWRINRELRPGLGRACRRQRIKTPRNPFRDWWQSPDGVICLWPEWFAAPQPDWPANARCIGFPLEDLASHRVENAGLAEFLAGGGPPVLFTPGTAMAHGRNFFDAALGACLAAERRAIFVTRYPDQLPPNLPAAIRHFDYLPFSDVLPRCAAIVHHGGIGTTSQALAAGIPQLIMPLAHDQPDNATRVRRLGAGTLLWPDEFTAENIARELDKLPAFQKQCADLAARVRSDHPAAALLDALAHV